MSSDPKSYGALITEVNGMKQLSSKVAENLGVLEQKYQFKSQQGRLWLATVSSILFRGQDSN